MLSGVGVEPISAPPSRPIKDETHTKPTHAAFEDPTAATNEHQTESARNVSLINDEQGVIDMQS